MKLKELIPYICDNPDVTIKTEDGDVVLDWDANFMYGKDKLIKECGELELSEISLENNPFNDFSDTILITVSGSEHE